jgi:MarR family 2-MHQ and catechol resistance regulon transcriptional repressor
VLKTTKKYGKRASIALDMWVKLARASMTFGKLTLENIKSFGLTQPQFGVLETLGHIGPLTLGELSRKQLVSGGNMTCVVDNLEKEGIVERVHSTEDRRAIIIQLTPKGQSLFDGIFGTHARYVAEIASVLEEDEQRRLSDLLKKLGLGLRNRRKERNGE